MFDVDRYLAAIGRPDRLAPDEQTLQTLHENHVKAIPYRSDPRDSPLVDTIARWNWNDVFERAIASRMGGNCFELNEPFRLLLGEIGFSVHRLSASSRLPDGRYGPEVEHQALWVELDGNPWLVDVGFGAPTSTTPLPIGRPVPGAASAGYRIVGKDGWQLYQRHSRAAGWVPVYRFKLVPRSLEEWDFHSEEFLRMADDLPVARLRVISRVVDGRTLTLSGRRFWEFDSGRETTRMVLDPDEYERISRLILDRK